MTQSLFVAEGGVVGEIDELGRVWNLGGVTPPPQEQKQSRPLQGAQRTAPDLTTGPRGDMTLAGGLVKRNISSGNVVQGEINKPQGGPGAPSGSGPTTPGTPPSGSSGSTGGGGQVRTGPSPIRAYSTAIGLGILQAGVAAIIGVLRAKFDRSIIENQMKNLTPQIDDAIRAQKKLRAHLQVLDQKAYANVIVEILQQEIIEPGIPSIRSTTLPAVGLEMVQVTNVKTMPNNQTRPNVSHGVGYKDYSTYITYSVELPPLPQAAIEEFKRLFYERNGLIFAMGDVNTTGAARAHFFHELIKVDKKLLEWEQRD